MPAHCRRGTILPALIVLAIAPAATPTLAQDADLSLPPQYSLQFQNDELRVLLEAPRGARAPLPHEHPAALVVVPAPDSKERRREFADAREVLATPGVTLFWRAAGPHRGRPGAVQGGAGWIEIIGEPEPCAAPPDVVGDDTGRGRRDDRLDWTTVLDNERLLVRSLAIPPGRRLTLVGDPADRVLITTTDPSPRGGHPEPFALDIVSADEEHAIRNDAGATLRVILVSVH